MATFEGKSNSNADYIADLRRRLQEACRNSGNPELVNSAIFDIGAGELAAGKRPENLNNSSNNQNNHPSDSPSSSFGPSFFPSSSSLLVAPGNNSNNHNSNSNSSSHSHSHSHSHTPRHTDTLTHTHSLLFAQSDKADTM
mmetsp:Transcript_52195/g.113701  ORF Transcript_52195/g.113701 Transcript_52195/m.113701 type:complete len:140 (-) Transcript_52195:73-492(-)